MSLTAARLAFASEFITLVVTAAALALILLRPQVRMSETSGASGASGASDAADGADGAGTPGGFPNGRPHPALVMVQAVVSVLALAALTGAAFAHGALLVSGRNVQWIGLARAAAAAVAVLAFPYPGRPRATRPPVGRLFLLSGFLCWLAAGVVQFVSGPTGPTEALLVAGSVLVAGALLGVARRAIAVRVAASGAVTLLLVVVVLALGLSSVISSSVERQELRQLSSRTAVEKAALGDSTPLAVQAQDVEALISFAFQQSTLNPLTQFASGPSAQQSQAAAVVLARLNTIPPRADRGIVIYANPAGTTFLIAGQKAPLASPGFRTAPDLGASCTGGHQGLYDFNGALWLAASTPECTTAGTLLGVVIVGEPLDTAYLAGRHAIDPGVGLALVSGPKVFAASGMTPADAHRIDAELGVAAGQSVTKAVGDGFVSGASLDSATSDGGRSAVHLLLTDSADSVLSTRNQLFRTLFLIAFGGTVLALGLAVFTGDRITAGVRRLTRAAAGIARGDTTARGRVAGDDEVATLGSAFDSMMDSVSAQAAALRAAAADEARLRNRLQAVVAGMNDALVAVDTYGGITDFNRAAVELTEVDAADALGRPLTEVVTLVGEDGAPVGEQFLLSAGRGVSLVAHLARGEVRIPVAVSSGVLEGPAGEAVGTVLVFRDMRREQEVERMKTEFLSRIGHELRTPLTGILGYADILLRRSVSDERARAWHEDILYSARRLLRIVEMLEFFASEGAGRVVLRPEPVDVRALVNGIASSWSGRIPANLTIGKRLPTEDTVVAADRRWLTLAVDELIDNAVKFSPEGGRILIRVSSADGSVDISVADQGMGMTAQHHEVVFGEFVQGDNSDTRRFGGLGLGLAVVRRVVEGHGGTINCRSAPGKGTTFVVSLPSPSLSPAPSSGPTPSSGPSPSSGPGAAPGATPADRGAATDGKRRRPLRAARPARRPRPTEG